LARFHPSDDRSGYKIGGECRSQPNDDAADYCCQSDFDTQFQQVGYGFTNTITGCQIDEKQTARPVTCKIKYRNRQRVAEPHPDGRSYFACSEYKRKCQSNDGMKRDGGGHGDENADGHALGYIMWIAGQLL